MQKIERNLPTQVVLGSAAAAAAAAIEGAAGSAQAVVVGNLVFNLIM